MIMMLVDCDILKFGMMYHEIARLCVFGASNFDDSSLDVFHGLAMPNWVGVELRYQHSSGLGKPRISGLQRGTSVDY